jgi:hypothetical protein
MYKYLNRVNIFHVVKHVMEVKNVSTMLNEDLLYHKIYQMRYVSNSLTCVCLRYVSIIPVRVSCLA